MISGYFQVELELVGYHGDKLAVSRLAAGVLYGVAEVGVEHIDVAPVPSDLDGVTDGTLDARRSCFEGLCDRGIEQLRDGIHYLAVVDREYNRLAQILIALYVRGHADAVHYLGDGDLKAVVGARKGDYISLRRGGEPRELLYPLNEHLRIKGLYEIVVRAVLSYLLLEARIRV